nr:putative hydroxymethylglutaryl-CoA lyase [uncultured bacterium]
MTITAQSVRVVEVGPRDGLQNEKQLLTSQQKIALIEALAETGLDYIEAGSFVNPKWVPQMAGSDEVFQGLSRKPGVTYAALTPNMTGFERAVVAKADEVAVFSAASEGFSQKNINCSIDESIERFIPVMHAAQARNIPVRGYVSCIAGCPYDGTVEPAAVARVAQKLFELGCREISLGDTIGIATPQQTESVIKAVAKLVPIQNLAVHMHDTHKRALENIEAAITLGIRVVDSSVAGLGGCPYAKGASGNVASEDVVALLDSLGYQTGVNLDKLIEVGRSISATLNRSNQSVACREKDNP